MARRGRARHRPPAVSRAGDRAVLDAEGVVFEEPRVWMTVRFRDFRGPGRIRVGKIFAVRGCFVVTRRRIVARGRLRTVVDLPCAPGGARHYAVGLAGDALRITVPDAGAVMGPAFSGGFSLTVHTPRAAQLLLYFSSLREAGA